MLNKRSACLTILFIAQFYSGILAQSGNQFENYKKAKDDGERIELIRSLAGSQPDIASRNLVIIALREGVSSALRREAALTLGIWKTGRLDLQRAFDEDDTYVRSAALSSLAEIADPASNLWFEKGFNDKGNADTRLA